MMLARAFLWTCMERSQCTVQRHAVSRGLRLLSRTQSDQSSCTLFPHTAHGQPVSSVSWGYSRQPEEMMLLTQQILILTLSQPNNRGERKMKKKHLLIATDE